MWWILLYVIYAPQVQVQAYVGQQVGDQQQQQQQGHITLQQLQQVTQQKVQSMGLQAVATQTQVRTTIVTAPRDSKLPLFYGH